MGAKWRKIVVDHSVHYSYLDLIKGPVNPVTLHKSHKMNPQIRAKLFEIAMAEFTEHGFSQASLNRIIGSVGMSKSSFYHFFANKTELFQQIMEQTLAPIHALAQSFDIDALNAETFWPSILGAAQNAAGAMTQAPQILAVGRMFHKNRDGADGVCADMMTGPIAMVNQLLARGQTVGVIRKDIPPELLLNMVMALGMEIDRWGIEQMQDFDEAEVRRFNELALGIFMRLLMPEGTDGPV